VADLQSNKLRSSYVFSLANAYRTSECCSKYTGFRKSSSKIVDFNTPMVNAFYNLLPSLNGRIHQTSLAMREHMLSGVNSTISSSGTLVVTVCSGGSAALSFDFVGAGSILLKY